MLALLEGNGQVRRLFTRSCAPLLCVGAPWANPGRSWILCVTWVQSLGLVPGGAARAVRGPEVTPRGGLTDQLRLWSPGEQSGGSRSSPATFCHVRLTFGDPPQQPHRTTRCGPFQPLLFGLGRFSRCVPCSGEPLYLGFGGPDSQSCRTLSPLSLSPGAFSLHAHRREPSPFPCPILPSGWWLCCGFQLLFPEQRASPTQRPVVRIRLQQCQAVPRYK